MSDQKEGMCKHGKGEFVLCDDCNLERHAELVERVNGRQPTPTPAAGETEFSADISALFASCQDWFTVATKTAAIAQSLQRELQQLQAENGELKWHCLGHPVDSGKVGQMVRSCSICDWAHDGITALQAKLRASEEMCVDLKNKLSACTTEITTPQTVEWMTSEDRKQMLSNPK